MSKQPMIRMTRTNDIPACKVSCRGGYLGRMGRMPVKHGHDAWGSAIVPEGQDDPAVTVHLEELLQVTETHNTAAVQPLH